MKICSFNVNGIRARMDQLCAVLELHRPDVIGLQETKVEDALFPAEELLKLGYQSCYHGQKGHYGVALLYRGEIMESRLGFPHDGEDAQRRLVHIAINSQNGPLHIYNGYFPQGENRNHPTKFSNKENFYRQLTEQLHSRHQPTEQVIVMGDMNVAPLDKDIGIGDSNRKRWLREGKCCFLPEERQWLDELCRWGLTDTLEYQDPTPGEHRYSWFDYRSRGFEQSPRRGLRIDLILASQPLLSRLINAGIDQQARSMDRPSDHCPVWLELDLD